MNQYLKSYQVVMRTVGPVFIGSGKKILEKEYVLLNCRQIGIPDIQNLYRELKRRKKDAAFEEYLLGKGNISLTNWLQKHKIEMKDIQPSIKYSLDCGDALLDGNANELQIMECVKDAYGNPYIPGSSLKGMFRTILLGADIRTHPEKYENAKNTLPRKAAVPDDRTYYLKKEAADIESIAFRTLSRNAKKPGDAVNDIMQGFIVSDSDPLIVDALVLCQKIDRHTDGTSRHFPLLRECIKPETEIRFTLTVDTSICPLTGKALIEAAKLFIQSYYTDFAAAFKGLDRPKSNYVLCGGGCGFASKTMIYPMYQKQEGIEIAQQIFEKTGVPKYHKHHKDKEYGASPHIIKCTEYQGKTYQMGMCKIEKIKYV